MFAQPQHWQALSNYIYITTPWVVSPATNINEGAYVPLQWEQSLKEQPGSFYKEIMFLLTTLFDMK